MKFMYESDPTGKPSLLRIIGYIFLLGLVLVLVILGILDTLGLLDVVRGI